MNRIFGSVKFFLFFVLLSFSHLRCEIKAIIFDFGGVLAKTSESKFAWEIGLANLAALGITDLFSLDFSNLGLKEKVLEIMGELGHQEKCDNGLVAKHGNTDLPEVMCQWLRGHISGEDANAKVQDYLNNLSQIGHDKIKSEAERRVLSEIVRIMFDSKKLAEFTLPIKGSVSILAELKSLKHEDYKLLMLSNWEQNSFNEIYNSENMQEIFGYFERENIFISSITKIMKPSSLAYKIILEHLTNYKISPKECLMIDDQPENIEAAKLCGMQGILVDKKCSNLRGELVKLNILPVKKQQSLFASLVPFSWGGNS